MALAFTLTSNSKGECGGVSVYPMGISRDSQEHIFPSASSLCEHSKSMSIKDIVFVPISAQYEHTENISSELLEFLAGVTSTVDRSLKVLAVRVSREHNMHTYMHAYAYHSCTIIQAKRVL